MEVYYQLSRKAISGFRVELLPQLIPSTNPMKICYLDAFSGIGGDMLVGALADARADSSTIAQSLSKLRTGADLSRRRLPRCCWRASLSTPAAPKPS